MFDKLVQVLVFGCGYRRIADTTCSATTLRRRRDEWIRAGVVEQLRLAVLGAYERLFGLELEQLAVDGCITKAPCGGQVAGPSPVDRRKQGLKHSVAVEAGGIPLAVVPAPANRRDDGLLGATLDAVEALGLLPPSPWSTWTPATTTSPADRCWPTTAWSARSHPWAARADPMGPPVDHRTDPCLGNQYGKLRWCTERRRLVVEFWLALANAAIVCGRLVRRAWTCYRWDGRPRRRP